MNAAFKEEMEDMELDEDANDLDDCYYENEDDLVISSHRKKKMDDDDMDEYAEFGEDDDLEESVEEIIKTAEEREKVQTMRKSNFSVKAKIDILYDLLQTQKEK